MDRRRVLGWVRRYGLLTVMLTVLALRRITIKKRLRAKLKQVKAELRRRVLVRLTPAAYQRFLRQAFPATPMHMICESSPIIRATTVALFSG